MSKSSLLSNHFAHKRLPNEFNFPNSADHLLSFSRIAARLERCVDFKEKSKKREQEAWIRCPSCLHRPALWHHMFDNNTFRWYLCVAGLSFNQNTTQERKMTIESYKKAPRLADAKRGARICWEA